MLPERVNLVNVLLRERDKSVTEEALLAEFRAVLYDPNNIYEHRWRNGDFLVWSNHAYHHARGGLVPGKTRTLQRVCITNATSEMYDAPIPNDRLPEHMRK